MKDSSFKFVDDFFSINFHFNHLIDNFVLCNCLAQNDLSSNDEKMTFANGASTFDGS